MLLARGGGEGRYCTGVTCRVGRLEVREVADRSQHRIQLVVGQGSVIGSQVQGGLPAVDVEEPFGECLGLIDEQPGQCWIELAAAARPHHGHRTGQALPPQEDLGRIREMLANTPAETQCEAIMVRTAPLPVAAKRVQ